MSRGLSRLGSAANIGTRGTTRNRKSRRQPLAWQASIGQERREHARRDAPYGADRRMKMAGTVEKKLGELGIVLNEPASPVANYVGFVRTGNLLIVSGQLCFD